MPKDRWQPFALHLSTEELEEIVFALRSTKPNPHGSLAKKSRARLPSFAPTRIGSATKTAIGRGEITTEAMTMLTQNARDALAISAGTLALDWHPEPCKHEGTRWVE